MKEGPVKSNELVWRTLLDGSISGVLRWESLADLAFKSGVPLTTTHLATKKLAEIGAVLPYRSGGLSVTSPDKIATVLCAWRNLEKDTITWTTQEAFNEFRNGSETHAIGGMEAASHFLGGENTVADLGTGIGYVTENAAKRDWPKGSEVRLLQLDSRAELDWDGYSSIAQTYSDLFATPGWQASEFRIALKRKFLPETNWGSS